MNDDYKIKYSSKDQFFLMVIQRISTWFSQLDVLEKKRLPTAEKGAIIGDKESAFEYVPDNTEAQNIMSSYGKGRIGRLCFLSGFFSLPYMTCAIKLPMVAAASSCFCRVVWV